MAGLKVVKAAANEPVTLQMLKDHMHVTDSNTDDLIGVYLAAARQKLEGFLGRSLINKGYRQSFDYFPHYHGHNRMAADSHNGYYLRGHKHPLEIKLGRSPLIAVSNVQYLDLKGVLQTMLPRVDAPWEANTIYAVGNQIVDANGNIQEVATGEEEGGGDSSHSGDAIPTWGTHVGDTVPDGEITWTCKGAAPAGDFIVDTNGEPGRIFPNVNANNYCWPITQQVPNAVRVHFTAGYGDDAESIDGIFKVPLMIYTKGLFDQRDPLLTTPGAAPQELPSHLRDLLWEHRIKDFNPTEG
jgi:hypothetical protein